MNKPKYARSNIGSIIKSQDPENKSDYIQIRKDLKEPIVLKAGDFIQVETVEFQLKSVERALASGKLSEENADKARQRIQDGVAKRKSLAKDGKDFLRAELIIVNK